MMMKMIMINTIVIIVVNIIIIIIINISHSLIYLPQNSFLLFEA